MSRRSYYLLVLDVAIFDATTSHSSGAGAGAGAGDGDRQVLTGTKGGTAHCEHMDRRPKFSSVISHSGRVFRSTKSWKDRRIDMVADFSIFRRGKSRRAMVLTRIDPV